MEDSATNQGSTISVDHHMSNFRYGKISDRDRHDRESLFVRQDLISKTDKLPKDVSNPVHIKPIQFVHILNTNTNITRLVEGPVTLLLREEEHLVLGPVNMLLMPPLHYVMIRNPVERNASGKPVVDERGQASLLHGKQEPRISGEPFSLFPGEEMATPIKPMPIIPTESALVLKANADLVDDFSRDGVKIERRAGDMWLLIGPTAFVPQADVEMVSVINPVIIEPNSALHIKATRDFTDRNMVKRKLGDSWLVSTTGTYFKDPNESITGKIEGILLTHEKAVEVRAKITFVDSLGKGRKAGETYLITSDECPVFIPEPSCEEVVKTHKKVVLDRFRNQFGIVRDKFGRERIVRENFFLAPQETYAVYEAVSAGPHEALLLYCVANFVDENGAQRTAGERWLIYGPILYWPPLEIRVLERRTALLQVPALNYYALFWQRTALPFRKS
eukprot:TRINITY_DN3650_c0_g1_i2.p1 TRINITY_DN3650_c0_g1~~TRINITY_DN3650_c0_g1_i2.p1  ORF type:complete len:447 (-),score=63.08 TRINITY_DN3650_c0_g1_i2:213-1553(-)